MACACGVAGQTVAAMALTGVAATTPQIHPAFVLLAGALIVYGLWRLARPSAYLALIAFAVIGAGLALMPEMSEQPWTIAHLYGAGAYVLGGGILAYAMWRAFPAPQPGAAGAALGGAALATGCGCCLVTQGMAGMAVAAGASSALIAPSTGLQIVGWLVVALGLYRLGGWRAAIWVPVGALLIRGVPALLDLTGDWMVGPFNLRKWAVWLVTLAGTSVIVWGFVAAYRRAYTHSAEVVQLQPTLAGQP
jgi:hypothetical protein